MINYSTTRRRLLRGIAATGVLGAVGPASAQATARYVVTGGSTDRIERAGYTVERELAGGSVFVVTATEDAEDDLDSVGGVSSVTRDFAIARTDPVQESSHTRAGSSDLQWDKQVTDAFAAHDYATGEDRRIAIIDTGIDDSHPDLESVNTDLSRSYIDGEQGPHDGDSSYHGTHVAGIAAATGTEEVTGVAPDAELVSIRVFGSEDGASFADILTATDYAAEIGADAANMSIGTDPIPPQANSDGTRVAVQNVMQEVARQGTVTAISAGNSDADMQRGGQFTLPTSVQGAMRISATTPNDERAFYSNYGTSEITVGAPGGGYETEEKTLTEDPAEVEWPYPTNLVYSTLPVDEGEYGYLAGTSMAAPQVAGLVGLVREVDSDANTDQVENAIAQGADLVEGRNSPDFGAGRINALDTVQRL